MSVSVVAPLRRCYPMLPAPAGPYVHAVRHGGLLFVSGLSAWGTVAAGGTVAEQARHILALLAELARQEGSSLENLLKVTVYLADLDELPALRQVLSEAYGEQPPASTLVPVSQLFAPGVAVEIEAVIAVDD